MESAMITKTQMLSERKTFVEQTACRTQVPGIEQLNSKHLTPTNLGNKLSALNVVRDNHSDDVRVEHKVEHGLPAAQGPAQTWTADVHVDEVLLDP